MRATGFIALAMGCVITAVVPACRSDDDAKCIAPRSSWTEVAYLKPAAPEESRANFGTTIAMSSDGATLAITALAHGYVVDPRISPADAVLIFRRDGARWRHDATIRPTPANLDGSFGSSLALSGNGQRLVVTAPYAKAAAASASTGSVFVFDHTASGWKQSALLTWGKDEVRGRLGASLALSGDGARIAVGIDRELGGGGGSRVFDFESSTGSWKPTDVLPPDSDTCNCDHYGAALTLSLDGRTLVVGNWGREVVQLGKAGLTRKGPGHVWVYRLVNGDWRTTQKLESSSPIEGGRFGYALATSADGQVIAVGAESEEVVHVFREADGQWTETHRLSTPSPVWESFGWPLVLSGDGHWLFVGEATDPTTAIGTAGSLCASIEGADNGAVFGFRDDGRSFRAFLRPRVHHRNALFGFGLAISGDGRTLAIGAPGEDSAALGVDGDQNDHSAPNSGAVYLFQDGLP